MLHERSIAADPSLDHFAVFWVGANLTREVQQKQRLFKVHVIRAPAFGQAGARGFLVVLGHLAALHIGAEPARAQGNLIALILAQNPVAAIRALTADGACVAAFGIARTSDETA